MIDRLPIFNKSLRDHRVSLAIWSGALAAVCAMYISFWPMMKADEMLAALKTMPEALIKGMGYDRVGTPGGYITSTVYGLVGVALVLIYSIVRGARLLAGDEEDGTLELELTAPVERAQIYLQRLAALWVGITALVLVVGLVTQLLVLAMDMGVPTGNILAACLGFVLLAGSMGTAAYAIGAAFGRRGLAVGAASALAVGAFMLNAIGPVVELEWMTQISPFSWYIAHTPLDNGFNGADLLKLAIPPPLLALAGWLRFRGRDLLV